MKRLALSLISAASLFAACGTPDPTTTNQTCNERHACTNGACTCSEGPKKDSSCCNPTDSTCTTDKCDTFCKYCM